MALVQAAQLGVPICQSSGMQEAVSASLKGLGLLCASQFTDVMAGWAEQKNLLEYFFLSTD